MATPTLTRHTLDGALGPIAIDVRAGGRGSPRPAVLLLHGFKGFKDWGFFPVLAERLARAGVSAVTYNASGSGVDAEGQFTERARFRENTYGAELADLATMLEALAAGRLDTAPPSAIGVMGHSRGGGIAVLGAVRDPRVRVLVTWAAIASVARWSDEECRLWRASGELPILNARTGEVLPLGTAVLDEIEREQFGALDILAAAARVKVPWLIVHGTDDPVVPVDDAHALAAAARATAPELRLVEGANHGFGATHPWSGASAAMEQVLRETVTFFGRHLA